MTPDELFIKIWNTQYRKGGKDVDYKMDFDSDNSTLFILFQGSTTKSDWWHNLMFWPQYISPYKHMEIKWKAHAGIVKMWQSVRDEVTNSLVDLVEIFGIEDIVVAGHSQGGGIAQLCAEDLAWHGLTVSCITFGSPKVFYGRKTKKYLTEKHIDFANYENGSDIVPLLPPGAFTIRPLHVGEPFRLRNVGKTADYHMGYGNADLYK